MLTKDDRNFLKPLNTNDKTIENAFKNYIINTFSTSQKDVNVIDSLSLKNFKDLFNINNVSYSLMQIDGNSPDLKEKIENFRTNNQIKDYVTKFIDEER